MITRDQIVGTLTEAFPNFVPDSDYIDLPYVVLGDFARFLIDIYNTGNNNQLMKASELIERLYLVGDLFTREAATIGLLEGIQNTWRHAGSPPEKFADSLLPESRRWWDSLNRFWQKEIPHVGADINTNTEQSVGLNPIP